MVSSSDVNDKAYMRFYRKMEGSVIDVIILAMADRLSARGEQVTDKMVNENINALTLLLNNYLKIKKDIKPLPKLINGIEIMKILSIKQSPELGKIISMLKEAQLAGDITTKEDAIAFIKENNKKIINS